VQPAQNVDTFEIELNAYTSGKGFPCHRGNL
jgi:hypothetical protein